MKTRRNLIKKSIVVIRTADDPHGALHPRSFGLGGKDGWNGIGWGMIMPNVVCDTMALNKDELLPWDVPPHWTKEQTEMSTDDMELIGKLAAAS